MWPSALRGVPWLCRMCQMRQCSWIDQSVKRVSATVTVSQAMPWWAKPIAADWALTTTRSIAASAKHRLLCGAELHAVCACCAARLGQRTAGLSLFSLRCPTHELSSHASPTTPARRPAQRRAIENNLASNLALCRILVLQRCSDLHTNAPRARARARTDTVGH